MNKWWKEDEPLVDSEELETLDEPAIERSQPTEEEAVKPEPAPVGRVRVEFLDGALKGKTRLVSAAQAAALRRAGRVKVVDG
jgi:hypothetical protein